jgi:hypothetical protein
LSLKKALKTNMKRDEKKKEEEEGKGEKKQ